MKKQAKILTSGLILFFVLGFSGTPAGAQWRGTSGSGNVVRETRDLRDFNQITVGGAFDLYVTMGNEWQVEVVADDNLIGHIQTHLNGKTLRIRMEPGTNIRRYKELKVYVTLPAIDKLTASGASTVVFRNAVRQPALALSASGSSDIKLQVRVDELKVNTSGASDIHIEGYAAYAEVVASGSSDFRGSQFECTAALVTLSGSSDMRAIITRSVTGTLSGSSDLHIAGGNPEIKVKTSGSSRVRR